MGRREKETVKIATAEKNMLRIGGAVKGGWGTDANSFGGVFGCIMTVTG